MASIRKQKSGAWRVQVRRKGRTLSETFVRYNDAKKWGAEAEGQIDRGRPPSARACAIGPMRNGNRRGKRLPGCSLRASSSFSAADITALVTIDFATNAMKLPVDDGRGAVWRWYREVSSRASAKA